MFFVPQCSIRDLKLCRRNQHYAAILVRDHGAVRCLLRSAQLCPNAIESFVQRGGRSWIAIMFGQTTVEFRLLGVRERQEFWGRVGLLGDAIPNVADELKSLGDAQAAVVERGIAHDSKLKGKPLFGKGPV